MKGFHKSEAAGRIRNTHMLNSNKVRPDERQVVDLPEHTNDAGVVDTRDEHSQEICQKCWLFLEIERQSLIVAK